MKPWKGRIGRLRYFFGTFALLALFYLISLFFSSADANSVTWSYLVFWAVLFVPAAFYIWCLVVRRCHDMGWSGWFGLLGLIPFVGWIFGLVLTLKQGEVAVNKYGAPPSSEKNFLEDILNN
ncbi:MAG TPA: DUF805 domain-containing protein [Nitrososphaera sp.]|nr:DUF805 domain-containing protein [Nitrososphaera sp.]